MKIQKMNLFLLQRIKGKQGVSVSEINMCDDKRWCGRCRAPVATLIQLILIMADQQKSAFKLVTLSAAYDEQDSP